MSQPSTTQALKRALGYHRAIVVLLTLVATALSPPARAALVGSTLEISGPGCRFPDAAYGSVSRKYLVVWADYNDGRVYGRLVAGDGAMSAGVFPISDAGFGALYPATAFNVASNEFLVTWDDAGGRGGVIYGQRVRGSDGALAGPNFAIGSLFGGIRSAVAWSPVSSNYLVVFWGPGAAAPEVYGQRVSGGGALLGVNFNISNDSPFSGYPAVAWGSSGNQFLVTWDNEDGNIHGQRVSAATGSPLGGVILVTSGGGKDRSCVADDSVNNRWFVQYNDNANAGFSYDQYGQLVNSDGTLSGGPVAIAHTTAFEGDTQFGGDVAFEPGARRYFSSFGTDSGMGGQESLASGAPLGPQVTLGTGYYTSLNNAADPDTHRFLTAWEGLAGSFHVFGQLYAATLAPPRNFIVGSQNQQNALAWGNPADTHFTGTAIRFKTTGFPASPGEGALVVDRANSPGALDGFTHTNLTNWTTYYYSAFAHDNGTNYSLAAQAAATPRPPAVTIGSSDFSAGTDGWTLATWQAGGLAPGTLAWDSASGTIVSTGSGSSNNKDTCTREGGLLTKAISTAGRQSIQVEYDVMAALNAPPTGAPGGLCTGLEGGSEDKLVVYYSTTGTNGPWTVAQILSEGVELPTGWTRKTINLAGIATTANNPGFALRFQWQFNTATDTGRLDNIRVLSGAVTAQTPAITCSPAVIERTIPAGANLPNDVFKVSNSGEGVLSFTVNDNVPWCSVSPTNSTSAGPERIVTISYTTAGLAVGDYGAVIQIASTNAANSPQFLPLNLHVLPPACFAETFSFYDGNLTTMGAASWSGSASNQILLDDGALKIVGGAGSFDARHALSCAGSNGLIAVELKIRKGAGSGDFFWSIYIDDNSASPNNLARCYGGSTLARGRIANTITADMPLTGPDAWDDLYIKIDTAADTSEFFFNGVSYGAISHGATPTPTVGAIRIERLDRATAGSDFIRFDNLTAGAVDATPPRLTLTRAGGQLVLSWPATGMGATLQTATNLNPLVAWSDVTNSLATTNGQTTFTTSTAAAPRFFRLRKP
ncbi:MAG TPA: hypothetical protein VGK40_09360 [Verrucomicrobiae bacterium]|jgi:hypothetical protein